MADDLITVAVDASETMRTKHPDTEMEEEIRVATITKFLITVLDQYPEDPDLVFAVAGRAVDQIVQSRLAAAK